MYCKKIFLEADELPSTSTLVCYEGKPAWADKDRPDYRDKFVEIGNCHEKIRLHKTDLETDRQFLLKIALLRDELSEFLDYLYQRLKVEEPIPSDETDITDPELYEFEIEVESEHDIKLVARQVASSAESARTLYQEKYPDEKIISILKVVHHGVI
jgi:hypothetical protein